MANNMQYPVRLESFRWNKPGVAEAVYVQTVPFAAQKQEAKGLGDGLPFPMALVGRSSRNMGIHVEKRWIYRAGKQMDRSPTDQSPPGRHHEQWSMDVSLMQIPLTMHPQIAQIKSQYKGIIKDGEIKFAPYLDDGTINPFYNQRDFYSPAVSMSVEYVMTGGYSPSANDLVALGTTETPDSGGFNFGGSAPKGRSPWLLVEKTVRKKGNDRAETKTWRYGGRAGWLNPIYKGNFFQV
jgi:hypothetical protein